MEHNHIEYQEILSNILDKRRSICNCPKKFMRSIGCNNESCRFDEFSQKCNYERSNMSNSDISLVTEPECICGGTYNSISDLDDCDCTCIGNCNFSEYQMINPPPGCDENICTCKSCVYQSIYLSSKLLPSYFRNAIIKNHYKQCEQDNSKLSCDKEINREFEEIKQLLDAQKLIKEEFDQINFKTCSKQNMNEMPIQKKLSSKSLLSKEEIDAVLNSEIELFEKQDKTSKNEDANVVPPLQNIPKVNIENKKTHLKRKFCEQNHQKNNCMDKIPIVKKYTRRQMRIRYYYSGGTEHYGVKSGHKHCLGSTIMFKNKERLWKGVDNSTNNRGSGYIGASVKHKIQVIKNANEKKVGSKFSKHSLLEKSSVKKVGRVDDSECEEEPPLIHVHNKGRRFVITLCPKESDPDIKPVPIPFAITKNKEDSDSDLTESTLEFELHSPKHYKMLEEKKTKTSAEKTENLSVLQKENSTTGARTTITIVNQTAEELKRKENNKITKYKQKPSVEATEAFNDKKLKNNDKINKLASSSSIGPNAEIANGMKSRNKEKDKFNKLKSAGSQENKILWEEHQTQMQNRPS